MTKRKEGSDPLPLTEEDRLEKIAQTKAKYRHPGFDFRLDPKDSLISYYIDFYDGISMTHPPMNFTSIASIISVLTVGRVSMRMTTGVVYPNIFCMNIGEPGITKKSTALRTFGERQHLREVEPRLVMKNYPASGEAFIEDLHGEKRTNTDPVLMGRGALFKDECAEILKRMNRGSTANMKDTMMDIYEGNPVYRSVSSRSKKKDTDITDFLIAHPYLVMNWATTPEGFTLATSQSDLATGWLSRFLYTFPDETREYKNQRSMTSDEWSRMKNINERLSKNHKFCRTHPEIRFSIDNVGHIYNKWSERKYREMTDTSKHTSIERQMYTRLSVYALKLAMIFELSRPDIFSRYDAEFQNAIPITDECMNEAIRLIDTFFFPTSVIVAGYTGISDERNKMQMVLRILRNNNGHLPIRTIQQRTCIISDDLREDILPSLQDAGLVEINYEDVFLVG